MPAGSERPRPRSSSVRMVMVAMLGLMVVIVAFFSSYASALGKPDARDIPFAVSAAPAVRGGLDASSLLEVHSVPDLAEARKIDEHRAAYGALVFHASRPITSLVATLAAGTRWRTSSRRSATSRPASTGPRCARWTWRRPASRIPTDRWSSIASCSRRRTRGVCARPGSGPAAPSVRCVGCVEGAGRDAAVLRVAQRRRYVLRRHRVRHAGGPLGTPVPRPMAVCRGGVPDGKRRCRAGGPAAVDRAHPAAHRPRHSEPRLRPASAPGGSAPQASIASASRPSAARIFAVTSSAGREASTTWSSPRPR